MQRKRFQKRTYTRAARPLRYPRTPMSRIGNIRRLAARSNQQLSTVTKQFSLVDSVTMSFAAGSSCSVAVNSWIALSYDLVF